MSGETNDIREGYTMRTISDEDKIDALEALAGTCLVLLRNMDLNVYRVVRRVALSVDESVHTNVLVRIGERKGD